MVLVSSLDSAQNFFQPALAGDSQWVLDRLQPARCWTFNFPASAMLEKNKGARFQPAPSQFFDPCTVLVHCQAGSSRSVTAVLAFLIAEKIISSVEGNVR